MDASKKLEELLAEAAHPENHLPVEDALAAVEEWLKANREQWEITDNAREALALTDLLVNELRSNEDDCGLAE